MTTSLQAGSALRLAPDDPVAVVRDDLPAGATVVAGDVEVVLREAVPAGHKVALVDLPAGAPVRKYGQLIGLATADIARRRPRARAEPRHGRERATSTRSARDAVVPEVLPLAERATFAGIVRSDGRVATRNWVGVLTSVNCSAQAARRIAAAFSAPGALDGFPNVDGVVALTHGTGCGMAGSGEGFELLRRTLTGYAHHPNFGALLVVGLGCEVNQVAALTAGFDLPADVPVVSMGIQDLGGSVATVREGVARIREMLPAVERRRARARPGQRARARAQLRRQRRLVRHHRQPGARRGRRPARAARRHRGARRDARGVRRRAPADPAGGHAGGRAAAPRPDRVVGALHRRLRRQHGQQPLPGQQGRRHHDHPGEVARRRRQGRHHRAHRGVRVRRAGHGQGLHVHGHPRLRPGVGDGHRRRRARSSCASPPAAARCSAARRLRA